MASVPNPAWIHSAIRSFVAASIKSTPDRGSPWNFRKIWSKETDVGGNGDEEGGGRVRGKKSGGKYERRESRVRSNRIEWWNSRNPQSAAKWMANLEEFHGAGCTPPRARARFPFLYPRLRRSNQNLRLRCGNRWIGKGDIERRRELFNTSSRYFPARKTPWGTRENIFIESPC